MKPFGLELVDEIHKGFVASYDGCFTSKPLLDPRDDKFGRKPTFKNIRELTEAEVESLKVKSGSTN